MITCFATQIYQSKIKINSSDLASEIKAIQKFDLAGRRWSKSNYPRGYTSYSSMDQLHRFSSSFEQIEKQIKPHVVKYAKMLGYNLKKNGISMSTIWVNVMPPGAAHPGHIHPNSFISGTLYVQAPSGCSSLKFEDLRLGLFMNTPPQKSELKPGQKRFISISPKSGDLVLFESWLRHEVPANSTKIPRISVSFNYDFLHYNS